DMQEVLRHARDSESSLAVVLRHVEENLAAPPHEWRRIHGALCLLERLLRPVAEAGAADCDEVLVGRSWFEAKMQGRLSVLEHFDYAEDPRVVKLVRRAATAARQTAERHVLCDEGDE
ncbi:unnamed protein product, partial [Polarella glacialis]